MTLELAPELVKHAAEIERRIRPCGLLQPSTDSQATASRYGGRPFVPVGTQWPRGRDGELLDFIGQLNLSTVARCVGDGSVPDRGVVSVFYAQDQPYGSDPADGSEWAVYYCNGSGELIDPPEELLLFQEKPFALSRARSLPNAFDLDSPGKGMDPEALRALDALRARFTSGTAGTMAGHQVLGHAGWIQPDGRVAASEASGGDVGPSDWQLLWQIGSDDPFYWGAAGVLYVLVPRTELARGSFENAWLVLQDS